MLGFLNLTPPPHLKIHSAAALKKSWYIRVLCLTALLLHTCHTTNPTPTLTLLPPPLTTPLPPPPPPPLLTLLPQPQHHSHLHPFLSLLLPVWSKFLNPFVVHPTERKIWCDECYISVTMQAEPYFRGESKEVLCTGYI